MPEHIFCIQQDTNNCNFKITKTAHLETLSSKESSKTLSDKALLVCNDKGLYECRIKETGFKGFSVWAKNYATYVGQEYKIISKTVHNIRSEKCNLLKKCEVVYDLAPEGQVNANKYDVLDIEILRAKGKKVH